jgi:hypothetical protein
LAYELGRRECAELAARIFATRRLPGGSANISLRNRSPISTPMISSADANHPIFASNVKVEVLPMASANVGDVDGVRPFSELELVLIALPSQHDTGDIIGARPEHLNAKSAFAARRKNDPTAHALFLAGKRVMLWAGGC